MGIYGILGYRQVYMGIYAWYTQVYMTVYTGIYT